MRRRIGGWILAAVVTGCSPARGPCSPPAAAAQGSAATTVIVVRHGEKASDDPRDPSLSAAGEARAQALARTLAGAGVTHCFASEFRRTQATLAALAEAAGCEVVVIAARDGAGLVAALRGLPAGSVAVVAGHSNTVPGLVMALGGTIAGTVEDPSGPMLPDEAYDRLLLVHILAGTGRSPTVELRYGSR